ncbi:MAG: hypothetical protein ACPLKQ_04140 [Candidatus Bathyarchaeales archaeon]
MRKPKNKFRTTVAKLHYTREYNADFSITMNQLKLCIALELKSEGFDKVFFDRGVEALGRKVRVHVLAEDELGECLAVICVNRVGGLDPLGLSDAVEVVQRALGENGDVAIAIPVSLLNKAKEIFGIARKMFLVDRELRVWTHLRDNAYTEMIKHVMFSQRRDSAPDDKDDMQHSCGLESLGYVA